MKVPLLISLLVFSILLSIPSTARLPRMLPFFNAEVRAAAPNAIDRLRSKGLWLVNVDLKRIERGDDTICFIWEHRYRSRTAVGAPERITTCGDATET